MAFAHEINYSSQEEMDAAREATQNKWRNLYAGHIEEGKRQGRSEIDSMDQGVFLSRVMTPEENAEYNWAFEGISRGIPWRKWGGGNKMGIGGAKAVAARKARAAARRNAPDANVNNYTNKNLADHLGLTAVSNFVDSRLNARQGKPLPSNPSFGFSQQTLNAAGARGADPSFAGEAGRNVYGGDMTRSTPSVGSSGTSFSNYTGGLPAGDFATNFATNLSSFSPDSFLGKVAMNQGPSTPVRQYDGKFMPYMGGTRPVNIRPKGPAAFPMASKPRFAGIFAV